MNSELVMDEKGRIQIPNEIRKRLNFVPGEKFRLKIEKDRLILLKASTAEEFFTATEEFHMHLRKATKEPIRFEKFLD